jgi:hypothetical protein
VTSDSAPGYTTHDFWRDRRERHARAMKELEAFIDMVKPSKRGRS